MTDTRYLLLLSVALAVIIAACAGRGKPVATVSNDRFTVTAFEPRSVATVPDVLNVEVTRPMSKRVLQQIGTRPAFVLRLDEDGTLFIRTYYEIDNRTPEYFVAHLPSWSGETYVANSNYPCPRKEMLDSVAIPDGYATLWSLNCDPEIVFLRASRLQRESDWRDSQWYGIRAHFVDARDARFVRQDSTGLSMRVDWNGASSSSMYKFDLDTLDFLPEVLAGSGTETMYGQ
ncbi:MAG: hypothetical protein RBT76_11745 [candidate division Zixibacteria bacterium]|nr:hypothetical protein [candidate division Zixibacteria bacterium]